MAYTSGRTGYSGTGGSSGDMYEDDIYGEAYGQGYPGGYGRGGEDWEEDGQRRGRGGSGTGLGQAAQMAPLVVGGLMAALGLRRGGWLGYGIALAGLGVMQQAFTGRPDIYEWVGAGDRVDHEARAVTVSHSVTIDRPAEDLYRYFRDFSNLPNFMENLDRIEVIDDRHSHWVAKGPAGMRVSWEAEVTDDQENRRIAWRSLEGADVPNWGHVEFRPAPGDRGTEVHAVIRYEPPAGMLGRAIARLLGREPQKQMRDDLNRFKRMMETGESEGGSQGSSTAAGTSAGATTGATAGATAG